MPFLLHAIQPDEGGPFCGFVCFDQTAPIMVCNDKRNLGRVSKLPKGVEVGRQRLRTRSSFPMLYSLMRGPFLSFGALPGCANHYKSREHSFFEAYNLEQSHEKIGNCKKSTRSRYPLASWWIATVSWS